MIRIQGVTTNCGSDYHGPDNAITSHVVTLINTTSQAHPLLGPLGTNQGNTAPNNTQNIVNIGKATFSESIELSLLE